MSEPWWQTFFQHVDSLTLSCFPDAEETRAEIEGLQALLGLRPTDRIADVCCGMGRHLLPLMALGYDLTGLDSSVMMLDLARRAGRSAGLRPRLVHGLAQHLPFASESFDVILNLFNSFGYLPTAAEDQQVLHEAARCLKPGGRFLLDTRNKKYQILYAPYHQLRTLPDGRQLIMRCRYDRDSNCLESAWYEAQNGQRRVHFASIRLYSPPELEAMVTAAGFTIEGQYAEYDGEPFEGWQRQLLIVCRKGK